MAVTLTITGGVMKIEGVTSNPQFVTSSNGVFKKDNNNTYSIYDKILGLEHSIGSASNINGGISDAAAEVLLSGFFSKSSGGGGTTTWSNKYGLLFNGSNQYVGFGDVYGFDYTDEFSISFWIKTTSTADGGTIVGKQLASGNLRGYRVVFRGGDSDKIRVNLQSVDGTNELTYSYDVGSVNDGNPHHILVTNDGVKDVNLYIDGSLASRTLVGADTLSATIIDATAGFAYGARYTIGVSASNFFDGIVDEVSVYDVELGLSDAQAIYGAGSPLDIGGLSSYADCIGYTRNGEDIQDSATIIRDQIGSNDGIMVNMDNENFARL